MAKVHSITPIPKTSVTPADLRGMEKQFIEADLDNLTLGETSLNLASRDLSLRPLVIDFLVGDLSERTEAFIQATQFPERARDYLQTILSPDKLRMALSDAVGSDFIHHCVGSRWLIYNCIACGRGTSLGFRTDQRRPALAMPSILLNADEIVTDAKWKVASITVPTGLCGCSAKCPRCKRWAAVPVTYTEVMITCALGICRYCEPKHIAFYRYPAVTVDRIQRARGRLLTKSTSLPPEEDVE
jgi:hypothetical protein